MFAHVAWMMKCFVQSVAAKAPRGLASLVPGGEFVHDIFTEFWSRLKQSGSAQDMRVAIEQAATLTGKDVATAAREAVQEVAPGATPEQQQLLLDYLVQIPSTVRRSLTRPEDHRGLSMPSSMRLNQPEDLLQFVPSRLPRFRPGDRAPGFTDWKLEELLGVGGFGEVWKVSNPYLPPRALKICLDAEAAVSLRQDAKMLARVQAAGQHPGIVALLDTALSGDPPAVMCQFVAGGELTGLLRQWQSLPQAERVSLATQTVRDLAATIGWAHEKGIVHRDLKPGNILVEWTSGGHRLWVCDFGIGGVTAGQAIRRAEALTRAGRSLAYAPGAHTPVYGSPQQKRGEEPDPRDDVHALGVLWYQMLMGQPALLEMPLDWWAQVQALGLPDGLVKVLASCLSSDVSARPANAGLLAARITDQLAPTTSNLVHLRGRNGEAFDIEVTGSNSGPLWGTDLYTDDSTVGAAAVHAGLLKPGQKGLVRVRISPGQSSYKGSTRNGVSSKDYASWHGSFSFPNAATPAPPPPPPPPPAPPPPAPKPAKRSQPTRSSAGPGWFSSMKEKTAKFVVGLVWIVILIACIGYFGKRGGSGSNQPSSLREFRGKNGQVFDFEVTGSTSGYVWGTDTYTDDSSLAAAAVHAGILSSGQKGVVRVKIQPGQSHYRGSSRNGVSSLDYGSWSGSFSFVGVSANPPPENIAVQSTPTTLQEYRKQPGRVLYFRVTGATGSFIYGTDIYTDDSTLSTAAVHAGVLQNGETGIVKVTILPGQSSYSSTTRNGITSQRWDAYEGSFKVERASPSVSNGKDLDRKDR